jgi:hypothetical protein
MDALLKKLAIGIIGEDFVFGKTTSRNCIIYGSYLMCGVDK